MSRRGPISERLRDYVRARVRKDGPYYQRGNGVRLAKALDVDSGWVTTYTDPEPTAHATLDQSVAICDFYGITLNELAKGAKPAAPVRTPPADPLAQAVTDTLATGRVEPAFLWASLNAARALAGLPALAPPRARKRAT